MKSECKYCGRKEMIDGIGICCSCNDAYLDGKEAGIKYAGNIPCSCITSYEMAHETNIFPDNHEFTDSLKLALEYIL